MDRAHERITKLENGISEWAQAEIQEREQRESQAAVQRRQEAMHQFSAHVKSMVNPPYDVNAERAAPLELELATREEREAADAEARRRQKYLAHQREVIARRESGK